MEGSIAEGRIGARSRGIGCRVATLLDDADLLALLRSNPMGGWVRIAMEREPSFFSKLIAGEEHQAIIARDGQTAEPVGMCARTVRPAYVDGQVHPLGYIGELRIAAGHRQRFHIIRQGFETMRRDLHEPERTPFYLTAIVSDNAPARRLLEASLPGKPTYRPIAECTTLALRTRGHGRVAIERADDSDIPEIVACLARNHRRHQFAPVWTEAMVRHAEHGGPRACDFIVHRANGEIAGCLALWDQSHVRQAVIRGYHPHIARLRPLLNMLGRWTGLPRLPRAGEELRQVFFSLVAIDGDDAEVLTSLVRAGLSEAAQRGYEVALIALADINPMLPAVRRTFKARDYRSRLYLVHWDDGRAAVEGLMQRPIHVEAALL
jgi:Acetyltransferase (GNAT) domain